LVHGDEFLTPTKEEYGMYLAKAAALRSAELGRQVGAAICNDDGEVVALGANELPKAGGGLHWGEELEDHRDWAKGHDTNDITKRELIAELLHRLAEGGVLSDKHKAMSNDDLVVDCVPLLKGTRAMNLTEFGRAVHAEMAAITGAARRGISVAGHTLYTTTFPCHNCARHVIAVGLGRVVYIEPYAKSLASTFHYDALDIDRPKADQSDLQTTDRTDSKVEGSAKVHFAPFVGIAPRLFMTLFAMRKRKDDKTGKIIRPPLNEAVPRHELAPNYLPYYVREKVKARDLLLAYQQKGISLAQPLFQKKEQHELAADGPVERSEGG